MNSKRLFRLSSFIFPALSLVVFAAPYKNLMYTAIFTAIWFFIMRSKNVIILVIFKTSIPTYTLPGAWTHA